MIYDVIIIGGGPAGTAAAVYTARKRLKTLLLTETFGGQSVVSNDIQNWIGDPHISGFDLAKRFEEHVRSFSDIVDIKMPEKAIKILPVKCNEAGRDCNFEVETDKKNTYEGKTLIIAAGARRKLLNIPGESAFNGKGVVFCSTCDAPLFGGQTVAVVGGGNAGLEAVVDLLPYANKIYLMARSDVLKGDAITQEKIKNEPKVEIMYNVEPQEVLGNAMVSGVRYKDKTAGDEKVLEVTGVFVEIGSIPNSDFLKNVLNLDQHGQVIIDGKYATTSMPGIFAAGDITDDPYKQNNISAGDAVKAALSAYNYLLQREKKSPAAENGDSK